MSDYLYDREKAAREAARDEWLERVAAEKAAERAHYWARIERAATAILGGFLASNTTGELVQGAIDRARELIDAIDRRRAEEEAGA